MITRTEFDFLPAVEKAHTIFEFGEEIDMREQDQFKIKLYMLGDFFAELWYSTLNSRITRLESISLEEVAEMYGDSIDISDIFSV